MPNSFIIITPGRCGSEHVLETLSSYDDLKVDGEVFNRTNHQTGSFNDFINRSPTRKVMGFLCNREKISRQSLNFPLQKLISSFLTKRESEPLTAGFKLTLDQLFAYPYLLNQLADYQIIYLGRQNWLEQVLSLLKARQSGIYHVHQKGREIQSCHFDPKLVLKMIQQQREWENLLLQTLGNQSIMKLTYENLFKKYQDAILSIREFLNLPVTLPSSTSTLVKSHPNGAKEWVTNFDEIQQFLKINDHYQAN